MAENASCTEAPVCGGPWLRRDANSPYALILQGTTEASRAASRASWTLLFATRPLALPRVLRRACHELRERARHQRLPDAGEHCRCDLHRVRVRHLLHRLECIEVGRRPVERHDAQQATIARTRVDR